VTTPRTAQRAMMERLDDLDGAAAGSALDADADYRRIQETRFTGTVSAIRGDYMDVTSTNADGRSRIIRNVKANGGYRRMAIGDAVTVGRLSDGQVMADGLPSADIGGRGSTFWARVTQRFTTVRKDADGDDQTIVTRAYVNPLKAADGGELLAYATSATTGVETGMEVEVARDDGGLTDDSRDGYAERYMMTNSRLPADWYDRVGGRPQESYTVYADGVAVGTAMPQADNGVRAHSVKIRFKGLTTGLDRWLDSDSATDKPDGAFSVRDYSPQYWRVGRTTFGGAGELDEIQSDCEVIVETRGDADGVSVTGGAEMDANPEKTDYNLPDPPQRSEYPPGRPGNPQYNADLQRYNAMPKRKATTWKFTGKLARSVSIFTVDVTSAEKGESTRYTLVVEKNSPYR